MSGQITFSSKYLAVLQIIRTFAVEFQTIRPRVWAAPQQKASFLHSVCTILAPKIGRWCNGNTTGFGSVIPGSNPSRPTTKRIPRSHDFGILFCFYFTIHSNRPDENSSGWVTSKRKDFVFTGLKFTVQAAPRTVGYLSAPSTGCHSPFSS